MAQIDEMFRNGETETISESEKSYLAQFFGVLEGLVTVILIVTGLVALCIVFIAANTASMSVRERMREMHGPRIAPHHQVGSSQEVGELG